MPYAVELPRSRFWPRAAALMLMSIGVAACSSDSSRFGHILFGARNNTEATGSIPQSQPAPGGHVDSQPLPAQTAQAPSPPRPLPR